MKKKELEIGIIFYFNNNKKEDYIIENLSEFFVNYKSLSGTHTFTGGALINNFLESTTKLIVEHHNV